MLGNFFSQLGIDIWNSLPISLINCDTVATFKKLKRGGVSQADLVYYYQAVIRPVLEYACPVWHTKHYRSTVEEIGLNSTTGLSNYYP